MTLKQFNTKAKFHILKIKIKKNAEDKRLLFKYLNYEPEGQKITTTDPFGEENWNE